VSGDTPDLEDFLAYAAEGGVRKWYRGCRICDMPPEVRLLVDQLYERGYRRRTIRLYFAKRGIDHEFSETDVAKHFTGGVVQDGHS